VNSEAKLPTMATYDSCVYDLYLPRAVLLSPQKLTTVDLGVIVHVSQPRTGIVKLEAHLVPRGSMTEAGIIVWGAPISPDYTGTLHVIIQNFSLAETLLPKHCAIAGLSIRPVVHLTRIQVVKAIAKMHDIAIYPSPSLYDERLLYYADSPLKMELTDGHPLLNVNSIHNIAALLDLLLMRHCRDRRKYRSLEAEEKLALPRLQTTKDAAARNFPSLFSLQHRYSSILPMEEVLRCTALRCAKPPPHIALQTSQRKLSKRSALLRLTTDFAFTLIARDVDAYNTYYTKQIRENLIWLRKEQLRRKYYNYYVREDSAYHPVGLHFIKFEDRLRRFFTGGFKCCQTHLDTWLL
jgi:dUTPase